MSNSLRSHGRQHSRLPCSSLSPRVCSNSCPLSQWCYLSISSSAAPFSSCPVPCPASESFPMSRLFASSANTLELPVLQSFSFSISPSSEHSGLISFRIDWFDLLGVQGTQESSPIPQVKNINSSVLNSFFLVQLWWMYMTKTIVWLDRPLLSK